MSTIKILGADPSLSHFGFASATLDLETMKYTIDDLVLVNTEVAKGVAKKQVRQNSVDLDRAQLLVAGMNKITPGHAFMIAEVPVGSQSARAMAGYGVCIGVLAACRIPLIQVNPFELKFACTGSKHGSKQEMIAWATKKHPSAPWPTQNKAGKVVPIAGKCEHLADACGAIEVGIQTDQFQQAISMLQLLRAA